MRVFSQYAIHITQYELVDAETTTRYYYHYDGLGSIAALSNENNKIEESHSYDEFGEVEMRDSGGLHIAPGNPRESRYIDSFISKLRDEVLRSWWFQPQYVESL